MGKFKNFLFSLLTVSAVFILGYNFKVAEELKYDFSGDASDYIHLGLSLAKTGKYGHLNLTHEELVQGFKDGKHRVETYKFLGHSTWRPPIWPALIALCFWISGYSISFLLGFKFLLHILGSWLFYRTLEYFDFSKILIAIGVLLYAVNPAWQLYSRVFLSEPFTLFIMTLFIWSIVRFLTTERGLWLNTLLGGILVLSHPYYIFLPFSIWAFLFLYRKLKFKQILVLGSISILIISTWMLRNYVVLEEDKLLITTSSGAVMAKGWNRNVPQLHTNTKGDLADERLVFEGFEYSKSDYKGEVGMMKLYQDATTNFVKKNPDMIVPIVLKKLKSAFNPLPETPRPGMLEVGRVLYQLITLLSIFLLLLRGSKTLKSFVLGLLLSTVLITIITYSGFRFRMPQSSLELLFIIVAISNIINKRHEGRPIFN